MAKLRFGSGSACPAMYPAQEGGSSGTSEVTLTRFKDDTNIEIGTHYMNFTDSNDNTFKVILLDAQYRLSGGKWTSNGGEVTNLPIYSNYISSPWWNAKETATSNCDNILAWCTAQRYTSPIVSHCRSISFTINNTTYYGQLPNINEVFEIAKNASSLNLLDTSASSYTNVNLSSARNIWSSNQGSSSAAWDIGNSGAFGTDLKTLGSSTLVFPVLEIPLNGNISSSSPAGVP